MFAVFTVQKIKVAGHKAATIKIPNNEGLRSNHMDRLLDSSSSIISGRPGAL